MHRLMRGSRRRFRSFRRPRTVFNTTTSASSTSAYHITVSCGSPELLMVPMTAKRGSSRNARTLSTISRFVTAIDTIPRMTEGAALDTVVVLDGLTHPHAEMYLETLEALDEVSGVVLVDPNDEARDELARKTRKLRAAYAQLDTALKQSEVTHVLIALPNSTTPAAAVRAIEAGKSVFTEKPGARSAREFEPVLNGLRHRPVPFAVAYLNRGAPAIVEARELYQAGAIGRLM